VIKGLGTDIIEIARIASSIERYGQRFLDRIFTHQEQQYCFQYPKPASHFAGRFAAKEAVVKALGTGFRKGISWQDIEIINGALGNPEVKLSACLREQFDPTEVLVSISHSRNYATAVAIRCQTPAT